MLLRSKLLVSLTAVGLGVGFAAPRASATEILDTFDLPGTGVSCANANPCGDLQSGVGFFSAGRTITANGATSLAVNVAGSDSLHYQDDGSHDLVITYSLGGQDVTVGGGDDFVLGILSGTTVSALTISFTDAMLVTATKTVDPSAFAGSELILSLMTDIKGATMLDLTNITEIKLSVIQQAGTLNLDYVLTPEPSTAGMLLLGLAGLAFAGRRNESRA